MWTFVLLVLVAVAYYVAKRLAKRDMRYAWGVGGAGLVLATAVGLKEIVEAYTTSSSVWSVICYTVGAFCAWWMYRHVMQLKRQNFWSMAKLWAAKKRDVILSRRRRS
ncbi:MAG: hypothetical protein U9Q03_03940 [Patescibacteria group bacterium]|nr:hypothetical protein [Patescibacteria group bacterium]